MFHQRLDELVNLKHPLALLTNHIDWSVFEREWGYFPSSRGRIATSTRLIAGLLYLQHHARREVLRLIAQRGRFLARNADGEPGVKAIWKGLTKIRLVAEALREMNSACDWHRVVY